MTILVTGANGGLGRVLMPLIADRYNELVIGAVRTSAGDANQVQCDITNAAQVADVIRSFRPRLIYHLAGSFTGNFETDYAVNALGAKHLFDAILHSDLNTRVLLAGSAAEYGLVSEADNPIKESQPLNPVSVYGLTKTIQTEIANFYIRTKSLDLVIARIFNLAIPGLSEKLFYGRAAVMIKAYKEGSLTTLEFGNLDSKRDYIDLALAAKQLFAIADFGESGATYNVGSGSGTVMRDVLAKLLEDQSITNAKVVESSPDIVKFKGFDIPTIYADTTKVTKLLTEAFPK